ncbi:hypothetical protein EDC01DRAFT_639009 [Geopyxis carbonaria]|nr:hypothetical protein EDC01DRAFT_639009 [Geopyxis carbonaria]
MGEILLRYKILLQALLALSYSPPLRLDPRPSDSMGMEGVAPRPSNSMGIEGGGTKGRGTLLARALMGLESNNINWRISSCSFSDISCSVRITAGGCPFEVSSSIVGPKWILRASSEEWIRRSPPGVIPIGSRPSVAGSLTCLSIRIARSKPELSQLELPGLELPELESSSLSDGRECISAPERLLLQFIFDQDPRSSSELVPFSLELLEATTISHSASELGRRELG